MISVDTLEDNKAFALKEHADFPMLSNPDKKVAFAYQVISPDTPPERQFAKRWTYYIDPDRQDRVHRQGGQARDVRPGHRREARRAEGTEGK